MYDRLRCCPSALGYTPCKVPRVAILRLIDAHRGWGDHRPTSRARPSTIPTTNSSRQALRHDEKAVDSFAATKPSSNDVFCNTQAVKSGLRINYPLQHSSCTEPDANYATFSLTEDSDLYLYSDNPPLQAYVDRFHSRRCRGVLPIHCEDFEREEAGQVPLQRHVKLTDYRQKRNTFYNVMCHQTPSSQYLYSCSPHV